MSILKKMVAGAALSMLVASPVLAAAPVSPASKLSLNAGARAGVPTKGKKSKAIGAGVVAAVAGLLAVGTIVVVADGNGGSK